MPRVLRLTIIVLLLVTAGCSLTSQSGRKVQGAQQWEHLRSRVKLRLAQQQYDAGLFKDTTRSVSESIALDPTQAEAYVLLAKAHLECERPASAQRVVDAAADSGLESADLHYMQGVIWEQRGRVEAALTEYAQARAMDDTNIDYLIAQVECLVALDRTDEALTLLSENTGRFDHDAAVAVLAARIAALRGETTAALRHYQQAFATLNNSELIAEDLGLLLVQAKRYEEAITVLAPLIETPVAGHERGTIRRALATCYLQLGNPAAAGRVLAKYALAHPHDTLAQLLIAKAAIATNDFVTALRAVDLARDRRPNHPEVLLLQATTQWRRGDFESAACSLQQLLAQRPDDVDAHCLLGEVLGALDRRKAARAAFNRALEIDPENAWATAALAG